MDEMTHLLHTQEEVPVVEDGCNFPRTGLFLATVLWTISFSFSMAALGMRANFTEMLCSNPPSKYDCIAPHSWGFELAEDLLYYGSVLALLIILNCLAWAMLSNKKFVLWYFLFIILFGLSDVCDDGQQLYEDILLSQNRTFLNSSPLTEQLSRLIYVSIAAVFFDAIFIIGISFFIFGLSRRRKLTSAVLPE